VRVRNDIWLSVRDWCGVFVITAPAQCGCDLLAAQSLCVRHVDGRRWLTSSDEAMRDNVVGTNADGDSGGRTLRDSLLATFRAALGARRSALGARRSALGAETAVTAFQMRFAVTSMQPADTATPSSASSST